METSRLTDLPTDIIMYTAAIAAKRDTRKSIKPKTKTIAYCLIIYLFKVRFKLFQNCMVEVGIFKSEIKMHKAEAKA